MSHDEPLRAERTQQVKGRQSSLLLLAEKGSQAAALAACSSVMVKMADQQQQQELRKSVNLDRKDAAQTNQSQNGPIEPGDLEALTQYVSMERVQELMQQMQDKFANMSEQILSRIDDMSHRIEDIERNVTEISSQAGLDSSTTPTSTTGAQPAPPQGKENTPEASKEEKQ